MTRPARAVIVAIYQATFPRTPDWAEGPLPFAHGDVRADTEGRSTYYPQRTARLLYGSPGRPRRWHKTLDLRVGGVEVIGLEALRLHDEPNARGLIIVHIKATGAHPLHVVRALARRGGARLEGFHPEELVGGAVAVAASVPHTISFVTPRGRRLPRLYRHHRYGRWSSADQWLWALASRTNATDHPPDPQHLPTAQNSAFADLDYVRLSADWRGLILRDGLALVGCRPDLGARDSFYNYAELYVRSIYLDAALIGLLQLHGISELEDALASALDTRLVSTMADLERRVTLFRHELWWQHLSTHGIPNQLLGAYQRQHRLRERFDQVLTEISDFNRLTRDDEKRYVNNALVLFTLMTVPASLALALLQALGSHSPWIFGSVLAACVIFTAALLTTRTARVVLRSIRKRLSV
jgi:hypothetical protein